MKNICFLLVFLSIAALGFSQGSNCCIPVVEKNGTSSVVGLANVRLVIKTGASTSRILQNENLEALDVLLSLDSVVSLSSGGLIKFTDFADKTEKAINKAFVDKIIPTSGGKAIIITKAFRNTFKTEESYASMSTLAIECITQGGGADSSIYKLLPLQDVQVNTNNNTLTFVTDTSQQNKYTIRIVSANQSDDNLLHFRAITFEEPNDTFSIFASDGSWFINTDASLFINSPNLVLPNGSIGLAEIEAGLIGQDSIWKINDSTFVFRTADGQRQDTIFLASPQWTDVSGNLRRNSNVGIGVDPDSLGRLVVQGAGTTTVSDFRNSSGTSVFKVWGDQDRIGFFNPASSISLNNLFKTASNNIALLGKFRINSQGTGGSTTDPDNNAILAIYSGSAHGNGTIAFANKAQTNITTTASVSTGYLDNHTLIGASSTVATMPIYYSFRSEVNTATNTNATQYSFVAADTWNNAGATSNLNAQYFAFANLSRLDNPVGQTGVARGFFSNPTQSGASIDYRAFEVAQNFGWGLYQSSSSVQNYINGNTGFGTTSPARLLHVNGIARITNSGGTATSVTGRDVNGDITNITIGSGLAFSGGVLSAVGQSLASTSKFISTSDKSVTNTITQTSLIGTGVGSVIIQADSTTAGNTLEFETVGTITSDNSLPGTLNIQIYLNDTLIMQTGAFSVNVVSDVQNFTVFGRITFRTVGSSGTAIGQGEFAYYNTTGSKNSFGMLMQTTKTINTTINQTFDVRATWGTADADNNINATNTVIKITKV